MVSSDQATDPGEIGIASRLHNALELFGRTDQDGMAVAHYGYLTRIHGLPPDDLFSDPGHHSEATARFTFAGDGTLEGHHDPGGIMAHEGVIATAAPGSLRIYHNANPGGDFGDAGSFARGELIAAFSIRYHSTLNEDFHNRDLGFIAVTADLVQDSVRDFALGGRPHRLGRPGLHLKATVTGKGWLTDRRALRAYIYYGGNLVVVN